MIQLAYQAAYDPYHTAFRMLRIEEAAPRQFILKIDHLRIVDFYLAFPHFIKNIRFSPRERGYIKKHSLGAFLPPYGDIPPASVLFRNMQPIQEAAIHTLVLQGFFAIEDFKDGYIRKTEKDVPGDLKKVVAKRNNEQKNLMEFFQNYLLDIKFEGMGGLKDRTGLMEFKYDFV